MFYAIKKSLWLKCFDNDIMTKILKQRNEKALYLKEKETSHDIDFQTIILNVLKEVMWSYSQQWLLDN